MNQSQKFNNLIQYNYIYDSNLLKNSLQADIFQNTSPSKDSHIGIIFRYHDKDNFFSFQASEQKCSVVQYKNSEKIILESQKNCGFQTKQWTTVVVIIENTNLLKVLMSPTHDHSKMKIILQTQIPQFMFIKEFGSFGLSTQGCKGAFTEFQTLPLKDYQQQYNKFNLKDYQQQYDKFNLKDNLNSTKNKDEQLDESNIKPNITTDEQKKLELIPNLTNSAVNHSSSIHSYICQDLTTRKKEQTWCHEKFYGHNEAELKCNEQGYFCPLCCHDQIHSRKHPEAHAQCTRECQKTQNVTIKFEPSNFNTLPTEDKHSIEYCTLESKNHLLKFCDRERISSVLLDVVSCKLDFCILCCYTASNLLQKYIPEIWVTQCQTKCQNQYQLFDIFNQLI